MYTVYALIDPRDWSVHYVGMTDNVYTRFQQHIKLQSNNEEKNAWLQSLKDADVMVFMKTLETAENLETARQREVYWIQHYSQLNTPLTNRYLPAPISKGRGDKVYVGSSKVIDRQSALNTTARHAKIRQYAVSHPSLTYAKLASKFKVSERTVARALSAVVISENDVDAVAQLN